MLTERTVTTLNRSIDAILAEPVLFTMGDWHGMPVDPRTSEDMYECGTAHCIGGRCAVILGIARKRDGAWTKKGEQLHARTDFDVSYFDRDDASERAQIYREMLGLTEDQAARLFHVSRWPGDVRCKYATATTHLQQAKAAAQRIKRFIRTNGDD